MGRRSRSKGKRGELYAVQLLRRLWPGARRSANQGSGAAQPDVDGTPWWVEVKHGARPSLWGALRQAMQDRAAAHDHRPILLYLRRDRTPPVVVMLADDWIAREADWAWLRTLHGDPR